MRSRRVSSILLVTLFAMIIACFAPLPTYAQGISVSRPVLAGGGFIVTQRGTIEVEVNVTSQTYRIANVTLFYLANNTAPLIASLYTPLPMTLGWNENHTATYFVIMPQVRNDTDVWAFVVAFNDHGDHAGSVGDRIRVYHTLTPNPKDTELDLDFRIRDVHAKTMTVNASVEATLTNYVDYQWASPMVEGSDRSFLEINQPWNLFSYSSGTQFFTLYYWSGVPPELYPFDSYNFTYALVLPTYLNDTGRVAMVDRFGRKAYISPGTVYKDFFGVEPYLSLQERQDNAAWEIHTFAQFYPSHNFTASWPILRITAMLTRRVQQVNFLLLVPVLSLYALLGFSVLLRGLANRLVLYLTVFLFGYGFQSSVRALPMTPIVSGFSMIELVGLALTPLTVILAVFSILAKALIESPPSRSSDSSLVTLAVSSALDTAAIVISEIALYLIARVTVIYQFGFPTSVTYTLWDLNGWGYAFAVLLSLGTLIGLALTTSRIYRA